MAGNQICQLNVCKWAPFHCTTVLNSGTVHSELSMYVHIGFTAWLLLVALQSLAVFKMGGNMEETKLGGSTLSLHKPSFLMPLPSLSEVPFVH